MLLDTASLYYRAFYGVPDTVTAPDGTPVNAVRGLLDMIARLVRGRGPARLIACLDEDWRPAFRVQALPSYKAHRVAQGNDEQTPPALIPQIPIIRDVLDAAGIAVAGARGYEADDVIATLAVAADQAVDVVTGDRDLFQLVDDERGVRIIYTVRGLTKLEIVDEGAVTARYGIPGRAYADFAVLRGDPSDGLPWGARSGGEDRRGAGARVRWHRRHHRGRGQGPRRFPAGQPGQAHRRPGLPRRRPVRGADRHRRAAAAGRRGPAAPRRRSGPAEGTG